MVKHDGTALEVETTKRGHGGHMPVLMFIEGRATIVEGAVVEPKARDIDAEHTLDPVPFRTHQTRRWKATAEDPHVGKLAAKDVAIRPEVPMTAAEIGILTAIEVVGGPRVLMKAGTGVRSLRIGSL